MSESRDYFGEILALHGSGNIEALAKLALELANRDAVAAELERREIERKAQRKRQKQAERERRRTLSRDSERQDATSDAVARPEATASDVANVARHSPLPIPSPSLPEPHITTPLTPLPSPPPPARAREARDAEPDRPHSDLEVRLAEQLLSDADRNALTTLIARLPGTMDVRSWLSEMQVSLDGMPGHVTLTPEQLGQALRDYVGNGAMANPGLKHFRTYLRRASQGEKAAASGTGDDFDSAVAKWVKDEEAKERQHA